jgi:hypothetical protein
MYGDVCVDEFSLDIETKGGQRPKKAQKVKERGKGG